MVTVAQRPEGPTFRKVGGKEAAKVMRHQWRAEVTGPDPGATDQVFLHVLYPTETSTKAMPECSFRQDGDGYKVTVGGKSVVVGE